MKRLIALLVVFALILGCAGNAGGDGQAPAGVSGGDGKENASGQLIVYGSEYESAKGGAPSGAVPTLNATQPEYVTNESSSARNISGFRDLGNAFVFSQRENEKLYVYVFDVGYGESILLKKGEFEMLFDCGEKGSGEKVVEKLRELGVNRIEAVVITADDEKRWGGIEEVLGNFAVSEIWTDGAEHSDAFSEAVDYNAAQSGIPIRRPQAGDASVFSGVLFKFLNPQEKRLSGMPNSGGRNPDIDSVVAKVAYGNFCILLTSNAESGVENLMMGKGNITCPVLKVAKYGAGSATSSEFLAVVKPKDALLSVGQNQQGNPNPTILERMRVLGITLKRTDRDGGMMVESDGESYTIG